MGVVIIKHQLCTSSSSSSERKVKPADSTLFIVKHFIFTLRDFFSRCIFAVHSSFFGGVNKFVVPSSLWCHVFSTICAMPVSIYALNEEHEQHIVIRRSQQQNKFIDEKKAKTIYFFRVENKFLISFFFKHKILSQFATSYSPYNRRVEYVGENYLNAINIRLSVSHSKNFKPSNADDDDNE